MMAAMRGLRVATFAAAIVLLAAAPAGATTVVADQQYQWFYWVAPILGVSAVGFVVALWGGYVKKVLIPKYRGRKVRE